MASHFERAVASSSRYHQRRENGRSLAVALRECERLGLKIDLEKTTYYLGRETLIPASSDIMIKWRKSLFALMSRNATPATAFYSIPPERVIEIGLQVSL